MAVTMSADVLHIDYPKHQGTATIDNAYLSNSESAGAGGCIVWPLSNNDQVRYQQEGQNHL